MPGGPGRRIVRVVQLPKLKPTVKFDLLSLDIHTKSVQLLNDLQILIDILSTKGMRAFKHHVLE